MLGTVGICEFNIILCYWRFPQTESKIRYSLWHGLSFHLLIASCGHMERIRRHLTPAISLVQLFCVSLWLFFEILFVVFLCLWKCCVSSWGFWVGTRRSDFFSPDTDTWDLCIGWCSIPIWYSCIKKFYTSPCGYVMKASALTLMPLTDILTIIIMIIIINENPI